MILVRVRFHVAFRKILSAVTTCFEFVKFVLISRGLANIDTALAYVTHGKLMLRLASSLPIPCGKCALWCQDQIPPSFPECICSFKYFSAKRYRVNLKITKTVLNAFLTTISYLKSTWSRIKCDVIFFTTRNSRHLSGVPFITFVHYQDSFQVLIRPTKENNFTEIIKWLVFKKKWSSQGIGTCWLGSRICSALPPILALFCQLHTAQVCCVVRLTGNSVTGVTGVMRECSFIWIPPCITVHAV
jgi:hypothetical protein